jgi:hypothetical protein
MSSVLDIQYKKPKRFGGSAYVSILEQGLQLEGISKNNKLSYLVGARNRSNKNLLSRQETQGNYVPSSADLQGLITYQFNNKWQAEILGNISQTKFVLVPEFSQLTLLCSLLTSLPYLDLIYILKDRKETGIKQICLVSLLSISLEKI